MQRISFAPVLSATRSRDSCWITSPSPGSPPAASAWSPTGGGSPSAGRGRRGTPRSSCPSCRTRRSPHGPSAPRAALLPSDSCGDLVLARSRGEAQLALAHDRVDPRDVVPDGTQPPVVVQLPGGHLEAEVEQLLLGLPHAQRELLVAELTQLGGARGSVRHQMSPPSRVTIRHFIGSLWIARRSASRAVCSFGKLISNITRPGLMLATHHSGEP